MTFLTLSDAVDEEKARIKHSLRVLDFSVFCQNHEKVCFFYEGARSSSHIICKQVILFYSIKLTPPPSGKLMHMFMLQSTKSSFDEILSNQRETHWSLCHTR